MRYCPGCGTQLPDLAKFCPGCGTDVASWPAPAVTMSTAATKTRGDTPPAAAHPQIRRSPSPTPQALSIPWAYRVDATAQRRGATATRARSDVANFVDALKHNYQLGIRRYGLAVQQHDEMAIVGGLAAVATTQRMTAPERATTILDSHLQAIGAQLGPAQHDALVAMSTALSSDTAEAAAATVLENQRSDDSLDDQQRGDNLLWMSLVLARTKREIEGLPPLPATIPTLDRHTETSIQQDRTAGNSAERQPTSGTNGFAVAALILGLVGGSVLAIVFGHVARHQIRRDGGAGEAMALAGLILGYLGLVIVIVVYLTVFMALRPHH